MAVSKRTRFEVLRRDNYTCRYCRSTENQLTVDHVTPVALGGTDDPSNQSGAHHQQGKGTTMYRLLSLAAVLALAACSSAAPTAATTPTPSAAVITADPTPSATATATATPTPTVWTKTEAAAQYLALVKPPNDARIALNAQVDAHPKDPKPLPAMCQTVADTLKTFLDALAGGSWPTDARSAVDDVMASVGAQMNAAQQCAKGKTIADFNTAWDYTDPKPGSAQVLRAKLGLPAAS